MANSMANLSLRRPLDLSNAMTKKKVNGERYLTLGTLDYKYLYTTILKNGDTKEYYKCTQCQARLQLTVNKGNQIFQSTAHQRRDCAALMNKWQRNYGSRQQALQERHETKIKEREAAAAHSQREEESVDQSSSSSSISTLSSGSEDVTALSTSAFSDYGDNSALEESSSDSDAELSDETLMARSALDITISQDDIKRGDWMCSPIRLQSKCYAPTPCVKKLTSSILKTTTPSHVLSSTRLKPCLKGSNKYFDDTPPLL